jgi:predicted lipid-binding transport protein (Tim44 family)
MRRCLTALAFTALMLAATTASALASPGGGSSSFGGGGGGGGGGGFSGGGSGGSGTGGGTTINGPWAFVIFILFIGVFAVGFASVGLRVYRHSKRRKERVRRVELAAAEAAQDDAYFDADEVRRRAATLHAELFDAWNDGDRDRLRARLSPDLMVEWERRLDDFAAKGCKNQCEVHGQTKVEYVGLTNRSGESEDRAVVRVSAVMRDVVVDRGGTTITRNGSESDVVAFAEYWTLGRDDGRWILLSIEQDSEGAHHLDAPIVASPWSDEARLHDEALTELAVADAAPDVAAVADLDFDGDARAAALDLSNADGRFAPAVLEAAARRAVQAWAEAVDGADTPLEAVATPAAVEALLYRGDATRNTRLVVRGPRLRALRIVALDAAARPPTMTVEAEVAGRRYVEDRDTAAVLDGSKDREATFTTRWTMALNGDPATPWQIAAA